MWQRPPATVVAAAAAVAVGFATIQVAVGNVLSGAISQPAWNVGCPNSCSGHGVCVTATVSDGQQSLPASRNERAFEQSIKEGFVLEVFMHHRRLCVRLFGGAGKMQLLRRVGLSNGHCRSRPWRCSRLLATRVWCRPLVERSAVCFSDGANVRVPRARDLRQGHRSLPVPNRLCWRKLRAYVLPGRL